MESQTITDQSIKPKFHLHNSKLDIYAENAIKRSNVKLFINPLIRESSERLNLQNHQLKNLSQHLLHLKNSCNDLKKDITGKQNEAVKLKDETGYTKQKVKQLQTQRQKLEEKIQNLAKDVQAVQVKKQSTFHAYKTYEHILWRMKKDQITTQIRKNTLQKQITNLQKDLKFIENKLYSLKQYEELSLKGLKQAEDEIGVSQNQRDIKVIQMSSQLQEKKVSQMKKQQRNNITKSIQEMAAGDLQDADLIRIKRFFEVQIFLKNLLKDKMQRLKDYYEPYELAFFKIKSQTSVKEANSLKNQFFNFESQYQERTSWIKHLQEEIFHLQGERKQLREELDKMKQCQLDILEQFQDQKHTQFSVNYILEDEARLQTEKQSKENLERKYVDCELMLMKLKDWTGFQWKRMSQSNGGANFAQCETGSAQSFNQICQILLQSKKNQQSSFKEQDYTDGLKNEKAANQNKLQAQQ